MSGFGEERSYTVSACTSPISSYVAVREVPPSNGLRVFERQYLTDEGVFKEEFAK